MNATNPSATVNPAVAHTKLDFRLLPGQRPDAIFDKLVAHLEQKGFADVAVEELSCFEPASSSIRERLPQAILAASREVYGVEPIVYPWSVGSSTTCSSRGSERRRRTRRG